MLPQAAEGEVYMFDGMYRGEVECFIQEHRCRLTKEVSTSSAQQKILIAKWRQWLAWLGAHLITWGQKLVALSSTAPSRYVDDKRAYAQEG